MLKLRSENLMEAAGVFSNGLQQVTPQLISLCVVFPLQEENSKGHGYDFVCNGGPVHRLIVKVSSVEYENYTAHQCVITSAAQTTVHQDNTFPRGESVQLLYSTTSHLFKTLPTHPNSWPVLCLRHIAARPLWGRKLDAPVRFSLCSLVQFNNAV